MHQAKYGYGYARLMTRMLASWHLGILLLLITPRVKYVKVGKVFTYNTYL